MYSIALSKDNKYFVSNSRDKSIIVYDLNSNFNKISQLQDYCKLRFSIDSKYLFSKNENNEIIYEINALLDKYKSHQDYSDYISSLAFSKNNRYLACGCNDKSLIIYEVNQNFTKINQIQDNDS